MSASMLKRQRGRKSKILGLWLLVLLWHGARIASAQDIEQDEGAGPSTLEFSFSNPGARSMGLGGAFAALADDATAAFANPAGLIQLNRSEISTEIRQWNYSTPFTEGGRLTGEPTGIGLDSVPGLRTAKTSDEVSGLSFISFVYPKEDWALAFYRHELANFRSSSETQGLFADGDLPGFVRRFFDRRVVTDFEVISFGVSGAYRLNDKVSIGLGLAHAESSALSSVDLFVVDEPAEVESFFGPVSFLPERRSSSIEIRVDDSDLTFNLGLLWQISRAWSAGAFYRQGPAYRLVQEPLISGPGLEPDLAAGTLLEPREESPFELPDVFGIGVAFRSEDGALTVSFEWDRVEYSTITDGFDPAFADDELTLTDADEIHLGFEYVFAHSQPIVALRLGGWLDPDHLFRFVGGDDSIEDTLSRAIQPGGEDELHLSAGVGVAFRRFQVDLAVDLSDLRDTASISAIYSF